MGGSSSTDTGRRITLETNMDGGVVKVSEDVLRRMFGGEDYAPRSQDADPARTQPFSRQTEQRWKMRMDELEEHYRERLREAEEKSSAFYKLTADQFEKAANEVEAKFMKQRYVPICENLQNEVAKCYADNPKQTLNCAQEVKAFNACIEEARMNILLKRTTEAAS